jgi:hypothetical protein
MSKSCPKCGGRMDQGFLLELKDGNQKAVTEWVEGMPHKKWYGLSIRGQRKLTVETWRCGRCAYLESYAPDA